MHSVDGVEDACSNDFGAISKVEWEDAVAGGRRTDVKSDFEEVDRIISTFGSDPGSVSVLGVMPTQMMTQVAHCLIFSEALMGALFNYRIIIFY